MVKAIPAPIRVLAVVFVLLTVVVLLAPLIVVVGVSFSQSEFIAFPPAGFSLRWYQEVLTSNTYVPSAVTSFKVAILVTFTGVRLMATDLLVSTPPAPSSTVIRKLSDVGEVTCAPLWV